METPAMEKVVVAAEVKNEVKCLERRHLEGKGYGYTKYFEIGQGPKGKDEKDEDSDDDKCDDDYTNYTFRSVEYYSRYGGRSPQRSLEIRSEPVKEALEDIILGFPKLNFSEPVVKLDYPLNALWIYREKLNALVEKEGSTELGQHLGVLMKYLADEWASFDKKLKYWTDAGLITYEYLWTLYQPGSLVFSTSQGQPRIFRLESFTYNENCHEQKSASINTSYIDYDGVAFGENSENVTIKEFEGSRRIHELKMFPLENHPQKEIIVRRLIKRGTKFVSLQGFHCKKYVGSIAGDCNDHINTRVMVDAKASDRFGRYSTRLLPLDSGLKRRKRRDNGYDNDEEGEIYTHVELDDEGNVVSKAPEEPKVLELTDEQKLLCEAVVQGFTLDDDKRWVSLFVDQIQDIKWNQESFSKLVLPSDTKDLIRGLVESHIDRKSNFDDFIEGKGKGLIAVLHGPPGLGKTMTAETVSEYTKSPLYTLSAGSLGVKPNKVEQNLREQLALAQRWNAVLLLDEADVFLEERSLHDIKRNALVSIFLRLVEYYQGILFLTTNRVKTFDDAFQSRIHVALRYSNLTPEAREEIWRNFVNKIEGTRPHVTDKDYKELAAVDLNGRQIKNAVRTALSTADTHGETLALKHFKIVLGVMSDFENDLKDLKGWVGSS
ncbi:Spastin [Dactylellina cionopaga]|nr:Spastin [Dactylellina cionopaga]